MTGRAQILSNRVCPGIGRSSLYKLFNEGKLIPRKAGKRTLILVTELEGYLRSLPQGGFEKVALGRKLADADTKPEAA